MKASFGWIKTLESTQRGTQGRVIRKGLKGRKISWYSGIANAWSQQHA